MRLLTLIDGVQELRAHGEDVAGVRCSREAYESLQTDEGLLTTDSDPTTDGIAPSFEVTHDPSLDNEEFRAVIDGDLTEAVEIE